MFPFKNLKITLVLLVLVLVSCSLGETPELKSNGYIITAEEDGPSEKWAEYLIGSLKEYGIEDGIVLELGCGTGVMTELLAESGYDMIGVDNSEEMLGEAMEKRAESGHEILYLEQDMREFELYGTVRAVVSVCDCMNYITEEDDLLTVFKLVNNYLDPDGIFYRNGMGDLIYKSDSDLHVCFEVVGRQVSQRRVQAPG